MFAVTADPGKAAMLADLDLLLTAVLATADDLLSESKTPTAA